MLCRLSPLPLAQTNSRAAASVGVDPRAAASAARPLSATPSDRPGSEYAASPRTLAAAGLEPWGAGAPQRPLSAVPSDKRVT